LLASAFMRQAVDFTDDPNEFSLRKLCKL